jgi:hypothetical protein
MSEDDGLKGRSASQAPEQASGPVRVCPSIEQEGHEYRQARSVKVPDPAKLSDGISPTYDYWHI